MTAPFTCPLDIEVWADREADLEALFTELRETDPQPDDEMQPELEGAR
jgi:hypothetical protein